MTSELHVIVNPSAGNGRTRSRWPAIMSQLTARGFAVIQHETTAAGHATELARELTRAGVEEIVVAGGDGTFNEVVNGSIQDGRLPKGLVFSLLPCGTGRDIARNLDIHGLEQAVGLVGTGSVRAIDLGLIHYANGHADDRRYFINVADIGLGAETAARINRSSKALGGFLAYLLGAARTIIVFRGQSARVVVDGNIVHDGGTGMVVIANGRFHAGGMLIAPMASMGDGALEVLILRDVPKWVLLGSLLPKVYRGKHIGHPAVHHVQGRTIEIQAPNRILLEMDGEQPGTTNVHVSAVPAALRVRAPI